MKGRRPSGGAASVHVLPVVFRLMRHAVRGGGRLLLWIRPEGVLPLRVIEHLRHEALMSAIWRYGNDAVFSFRGKNPFLRAAFFPHALFAGKRSVARREPGRPYGEKAPAERHGQKRRGGEGRGASGAVEERRNGAFSGPMPRRQGSAGGMGRVADERPPEGGGRHRSPY